MQTLEYRTIDKSSWGNGPWQDEPDKIQWQDEATGLPCLIVRGPFSGGLCGYVGVAPGHPLHGQHYSSDSYDQPVDGISVHGGLTFSSGCADHSRAAWRRTKAAAAKPNTDQDWKDQWAAHLGSYDAYVARAESTMVCHKPAVGEPDSVWWFGFDCNHSGDLAPSPDMYHHNDGIYRDVAYVKTEVAQLALQISKIQGESNAHRTDQDSAR